MGKTRPFQKNQDILELLGMSLTTFLSNLINYRHFKHFVLFLKMTIGQNNCSFDQIKDISPTIKYISHIF